MNSLRGLCLGRFSRHALTLALCLVTPVSFGAGIIDTVAGGHPKALALPETGLNPSSVTEGLSGRVLMSIDTAVYEVASEGPTLIAGSDTPGAGGDGGPALAARFDGITDIVLDATDTLWIADSGNFRIRRIDGGGTGTVATVAGNGLEGSGSDGSLATDIPLGRVTSIAVDPAGNLYFAESSNFRIRRVDAVSGIVTTVAGAPGIIPDAIAGGIDGGPFPIGEVSSIALDDVGRLWFADISLNVVFSLDLAKGVLTPLDPVIDPGDGTTVPAPFLQPVAISVDVKGGLLYVADRLCPDATVCKAGEDGADTLKFVEIATSFVKPVAGGGAPADGIGDGDQPTLSRLGLTADIALAIDGRVWICDGLNRRLRVVDVNGGNIRTILGNGASRFSGDGQPALETLLGCPTDLSLAEDGTFWFSDSANDRIRLFDGVTVKTLIGGGPPRLGDIGDGGDPIAATLNAPMGIDLDAGFVWIADTGHGRIRRVDLALTLIETVAGGGPSPMISPTTLPALEAGFILPTDVVVGPAGFYIADPAVSLVHRGVVGGDVVTVAGGGVQTDDGIPAQLFRLQWPIALAVDPADNLYIADRDAGAVYRVSGGRIQIVAGGGATPVDVGSPVDAREARLFAPSGLFLDDDGGLWISDPAVDLIYRLIRGRLQAFAGSGRRGFAGDGGEASLAELHTPLGVVADTKGRNLFFADKGNHRLRRVTLPLLNPNFTLDRNSGTVSGGDPANITSQELLPANIEVFFGTTAATDVLATSPTSVSFSVPPGNFPPETVDVTVRDGNLSFPVSPYTYLNELPVAVPHPDGPTGVYVIGDGSGLQLDGTRSNDPNEVVGDQIVQYDWEVNDPANPVRGATPVLTAPELALLGIAGPGTYPISLTVTDRVGGADTRSTSLLVVQLAVNPATGSINGGYPANVAVSSARSVTRVLFGPQVAPIEAVVDDGNLTVTVPTGLAPAGPVDVSVEFDGQAVVLTDGFTYTNDPPVANASPRGLDPAYTIRLGDSLLLDGSASSDPNEIAGDAVVRYAWDLDNDGDFDRRGEKVFLNPGELESFGLDKTGDSLVTLLVADRSGDEDTDTVTIRIRNRATTFPNDDFVKWEGDADENKIDDQIDNRLATDVIDTVIIFNEGTDLDAAAARLAPIASAPPTPIPLISAICLQGVRVSDLRSTVSGEAELFRVEEDEIFEVNLDISSRAVRAAASSTFSPETAADLGIDGSGTNIAFLDSGVDDGHSALSGKFVAGFNAFVDDPAALGSQSNPDDDLDFAAIFHGTHVAGIALGSDATFTGVAPGAKLVDVKVLNQLGQGTSGSLLGGLQWCINNKDFAWAGQPAENHGIDVVNMSLGSKTRSDGKDSLSMAVDAAVSAGLIVVAAAGNTASVGAGFGAPGAADGAITVGAVDDQATIDRADDVIAAATNFGPRTDDGDSNLIDELKPDVVAPGVDISSPSGNIAGLPAVGFGEVTGSSIAAAHVSGVIALLIEAGGDLDPAAAKEILRNTAEPRGTPADLSLDPTWNERYGKGIVDAFRALPTDLGVINAVWVSNEGDDNVMAFAPDSDVPLASQPVSVNPHTLGGGRGPVGIAVDGQGNVWLACRENASVTKLNSAGQLRFRLDLASSIGALPDVDLFGIAIDAAGDAWVTLEAIGLVARIRSDGSVDTTFYPAGTAPVAVAADSDGNVWIANSGSANVTKLDSSGTEVVGSPFAVGTVPSAIICDRQGSAYVANRGSNDLTVLAADGTVTGTYPAGLNPVEIALDLQGRPWVSNDLQLTISRVNLDGSPPLTVDAAVSPRGITLAGDGTLWVSSYVVGIGEFVLRLDDDGNILEAVQVGFAPLNRGDGSGMVHAYSVDPDGDHDGDGWTSREEIDLGTNALDRNSKPLEVTAVTPDSGSANGGTVVLIEGRGLSGPLEVYFDGQFANIQGEVPAGIEVESPVASSFPPGAAVDVEVRRLSGESVIVAAAYTYLNDAPVADPDPDIVNDGYLIVEGDDLVLDGTQSSDPNELLGDSIVSYEWDLNGNVVTGAQPTVTSATLSTFGLGSAGQYTVNLTVEDTLGERRSASVPLVIAPIGGLLFIRGEVNGDGKLDLADAIFSLNWLFGSPTSRDPKCLEAVNANGSDDVDIADPIFLISYLFLGTNEPEAPFPDCGFGLSLLGCDESSCQ